MSLSIPCSWWSRILGRDRRPDGGRRCRGAGAGEGGQEGGWGRLCRARSPLTGPPTEWSPAFISSWVFSADSTCPPSLLCPSFILGIRKIRVETQLPAVAPRARPVQGGVWVPLGSAARVPCLGSDFASLSLHSHVPGSVGVTLCAESRLRIG